ncbi:MAG: YbaK/EbsC family protein [Propionibacteriaceae bacterium]|nr:YbaK/EbsC family protein [Propionibacteriaceae bacterium]
MSGPGTLDWQPALDHPELVAAPVAEALSGLGATSDLRALVAPIDAELADTVEFCAAYGVHLAESANCVVVEGRRGDVTRLAAIMILATDRADVNKTVRKHLDVRKMSFASMETATSLTGMEYGGITPIGLPADWPILVDRGVVDAGLVVIGSGIRGSKIALDGAALAALPNAEVLDLALPSA